MKNHVFILLCILVLSVSCKEQTVKKAEANVEKTPVLVETLVNPTEENSETPRLFSANSKLYMSWVTTTKEVAHLYYSVYDGKKWDAPYLIAKGNDWFNNWADFPIIVESNNNILTTYLQKSAPDTYTYDIKLNVYNHSLKTFKKDIMLHSDGTKSEHGFVSAIPDAEGGFFVSWLDGRNTVGGGHHDSGHSNRGAMTLRTAQVSALGIISNEQEIDSRICDCCGTSMAMTNNGPVVVYRDRSDTEIRDTSISRVVDGAWTKPVRVFNDDWKIEGCPVNGPMISAFKEHLAVVWFTGVNEKPKVQLIFSEDNGENFDVPIRIDTNTTLGRVDVTMINSTTAVVSWMEQLEKETLLQVMKVNRDGSKGKVVTLSETSASRASGFPQIEVLGNKLIAAMTITKKDTPSKIKMVSVELKNL